MEARDFSGLYPAKRSPKYRLDRPITPQWAATGYNNFYEFTLQKERVKDMVGKFTIDPWTIQVGGLVYTSLHSRGQPQYFSLSRVAQVNGVEVPQNHTRPVWSSYRSQSATKILNS